MALDFVKISGQVTINSESPSVYIRVTNLESGDSRTTRASYSNGYFDGIVPGNVALLLEVITDCGKVVYSENIDPLFVDRNFGLIEIEFDNTWALIHGRVEACNFDPNNENYVLASWDGAPATAISIAEDGSFSKLVNTCGATEISLEAYDTGNFTTGNSITLPFSSDVDAGTLLSCGDNISPGLFAEVDEVVYFFPNIEISNLPADDLGIYSFSITDDQGNGNIARYNFYIQREDGNPDNPYRVIYGTNNISGSPDYLGLAIFSITDIELIEKGDQPGEFIIFDIEEISVAVGSNAGQFGKIRIIGMIE